MKLGTWLTRTTESEALPAMTRRVDPAWLPWTSVVLLVALLSGSIVPACQANPLALPIVRAVGLWVLETLGSYVAGKAIDYVRGEAFEQQLEDAIPMLIERIAAATGPTRKALSAELAVVHDELGLLRSVLDGEGRRVVDLEKEQRELLRTVDALSSRIRELEGRVDRLDARVDGLNGRLEAVEGHVDELDGRMGSAEERLTDLDGRVGQLEEAQIAECLDRRGAPRLGEEEFRVTEAPGSLLEDERDGTSLAVTARLFLDSCTADLTQRGLVLQISLVTRGLGENMVLYATFKNVRAIAASGSFEPNYERLELPLDQPVYSVDGQVHEFFIPYSEIPFFDVRRLALALVVTHDGQPLYALPDRVMTCSPGPRTHCRWVR